MEGTLVEQLVHLLQGGLISAAVVGIVEAAKIAGLQTKFAPALSIAIGLGLVLIYVALPPEARILYPLALVGAAGTGGYAIADKLGGLKLPKLPSPA